MEQDTTDAELRAQIRILTAHKNISQVLMRTPDEAIYLQDVCRIIVDDCGYALVWVGLAEHDTAKSVRPVASAGFEAGYLEAIHVSWADTAAGHGPTGTAIRTGRMSSCTDMLTDPRMAPWRAHATARGYASSLALPLTADSTVLGALTLYGPEPHAFSEDESHFLQNLANDLAYGLSTIRLRAAHAEASARYELITRYARDPLLLLDSDGRIMEANQAAEQLYGYSHDELRQLRIHDLRCQEESAIIDAQMQQAKADGILFETLHLRKDGSQAPVEVSSRGVCLDGHDMLLSVVREVSERKRAESTLHEHEKNLRAIMEATQESIFLFDTDGTILVANTTAAQRLGKTPETVIGHHFSEFMAPHLVQSRWERLHAVRTTGHTMQFEDERDGLFFSHHFYPVFSQNRVSRIVVFSQDITERHRAEEAERRSTERFKLLSEVASRLLATEDPQALVNELCRDVMRYLDCQVFFNFVVDPPSGRLRLNAYAGIPAEDAAKIRWLDYGVAVCGCAARDGCRIVAEDLCKSADPRTELVKSYGVQAYACHPLLAGEQVLGTLSFGTTTRTHFALDEITLMKTVADQVAIVMAQINTQLALRESELRFRAAFDSAAIGFELLDLSGHFLFGNAKLSDILGMSTAEIGRHTFAEITDPEDLARELPLLQELLDGKRVSYTIEKRYRHKNGHPVWARVTSSMVHDVDPPYRVNLIEDITAIHELQEQQRVFLHMVSHDLRVPLAVISGHAGLLQEQLAASDNALVHRLIGTIQRGVTRMNVMIEDLLDAARMEGGGIRLSRKPLALARYLPDLLARNAIVLQTDRIHLEIPADLPDVSVDDARFDRIMLNLLLNAQNYSPPTTVIRILVRQIEGAIAIAISDQGTGIHPDDLPYVFERHHPMSGQRAQTSVGLGLYISRLFVEAHGGTIRGESVAGQGSTFIFTLPLN